jgi:deoxyhypusine synthase
MMPRRTRCPQGLNRIGNMLVPNSNYCKFEDWIMPLLDGMLAEQEQQGTNWTPSKVGRLAGWGGWAAGGLGALVRAAAGSGAAASGAGGG